MKTLKVKIEKIIDKYASFVDDDSTYFVKKETKDIYINSILSLFTEVVEESKPGHKSHDIEIGENKSFVCEEREFNKAIDLYEKNLKDLLKP